MSVKSFIDTLKVELTLRKRIEDKFSVINSQTDWQTKN